MILSTLSKVSVYPSQYKRVCFNNIRSLYIDIALLIKYQTNLIILNQDISFPTTKDKVMMMMETTNPKLNLERLC